MTSSWQRPTKWQRTILDLWFVSFSPAWYGVHMCKLWSDDISISY
jgi:hypothetical protein